MTVLIGAALEPAGDLIEADAAREAAYGLLDVLRALGYRARGRHDSGGDQHDVV